MPNWTLSRQSLTLGHLDELQVLVIEDGGVEDVGVGVELLATVREGFPNVPMMVDINHFETVGMLE